MQRPETYSQLRSCGTAYCVAGHLAALLGIDMRDHSCREVGDALGMTFLQSSGLFCCVPNGTTRGDEPNHVKRAANGVAHIQRFLEANT
jgi:hypothetical protein